MKELEKTVFNVTGGGGGEAYLILGDKKTALVDTGMAYCAGKLIENIEKILCGRPLDYVLATHSHYDHIGAAANLKAHWPNLLVLGGTHAADILSRDSARELIRKLSGAAQDFFDPKGKFPPFDYDDNLLVCDVPLKEGDTVDLGGLTVSVYETPGHTKCSVSYFVEELGLLFLSESSGVRMATGELFPAYVTSYNDAMASIEKCKNLNADYFVIPHTDFIMKSADYPAYFEDTKKAADDMKDYVLEHYKKGMDHKEIAHKFVDEISELLMKNGQTKEAFVINIIATCKNLIRDFGGEVEVAPR